MMKKTKKRGNYPETLFDKPIVLNIFPSMTDPCNMTLPCRQATGFVRGQRAFGSKVEQVYVKLIFKNQPVRTKQPT